MDENSKPALWVHETHKDMVSLGFRVEETLFSGQSPFQKIDIIKTAGHGNMLLNDGIVMLSEKDEFIYHEMIAHVPLFVHPDPKRVLIIGGGDGGTAREVLKHEGVESVVMVEIDQMVVDACRRYMPSVGGGTDDPRLDLLFDDGVAYVKNTTRTFDVAIIDSTDPIGPAAPLFDRAFYQNLAARLSADGIMIAQSESPFYDPDIQLSMFSNQRDYFQRLHMYLFPTLTYPGGLWSFAFASKKPCPIADFNKDRAAGADFQTKYYNPRVHRAAFALPEFVKKSLSHLLDPVPAQCLSTL
ncbi:MAG: polyamine aminopropyltransferase [Thermodesulfobacteriota bacterium]